MNLESPKTTVAKSAQHIFDSLSDVKNFEKLMPENIAKFEVKKDGITRWELDDMENRFYLQERKRVPQNKLYLLDLCADDNLTGALVTANAKSIEFAVTLTATDNGIILFDVLDAPYNLSN